MREASTGDTGSKPESKLLQLPGELRNMIYAYVFATTYGYMFMSSSPIDWHGGGGDTLRPYLCDVPGEGLLQTCKQVHQEANLLPFKLNKFTLCSVASLHASRAHFTLEQRRAIFCVHMRDGSAASLASFILTKRESQSIPRIVDIFPNVKRVTIGLKEEDITGRDCRMRE